MLAGDPRIQRRLTTKGGANDRIRTDDLLITNELFLTIYLEYMYYCYIFVLHIPV